MSENQAANFAQQQDWLNPIEEKAQAVFDRTASAMGDVTPSLKDTLINNRLLGHTRHPTITDVPFGSWTVSLVADLLGMFGHARYSSAADISLTVALVASLAASAGGLADLSDTRNEVDRRLGTLHGISQGITMLLGGASLWARWLKRRTLGRVLSFAGYGTLIAASCLAAQLADRRKSSSGE